MLFLVAGDWFRRRRRPPRPVDDVPVQPLLNLFAFWALLAAGTFSIAVAGFAVFAIQSLGLKADLMIKGAIALLTIAGAACTERAFVFWWRLRT